MTPDKAVEILGYLGVEGNNPDEFDACNMGILAIQADTWIPVSKRLPTKEEYIDNNGLFNVSDGNRTYSAYFDVYDSMKYFGEPTIGGFRVDRCVIAWRPLPAPYKECR